MFDFWLDPPSTSILHVCEQQRLARLRRCAGSSDPWLVACVISTIISWAGSNTEHAFKLSIHKITFKIDIGVVGEGLYDMLNTITFTLEFKLLNCRRKSLLPMQFLRVSFGKMNKGFFKYI